MNRPNTNSPTLNHWQFRTLLELMMVSDPWPVDDNLRVFVKNLLNESAEERGYEDWVEAYHDI